MSVKRCIWPDTLSYGSAQRGGGDRVTVGGEFAFEGTITTASVEELETVRELVCRDRSRSVALTGPHGLLKAMTKTVTETALMMVMYLLF